jgi:predicted RNase H-like HicB family nuclease
MKFVIGLEPGTKKAAWGAVVPDLPGCFGAGDTLDEAIDSAREAIEHFCEVLAEDGKEIPAPSALSAHQANRAYKGWVWAVVEANVERFFGPAEKINITVPGRILVRIDTFAKEHNETRSGFLVRAATEVMSRL